MNSTLFITTDKWYKVILVWELYRILYNLLMVVSGLIGFLFLYANIPLLYLVVGLAFNAVYTGLSILDLIIKNKTKKDYSKIIFFSYWLLSSLIVIGVPAGILLNMWLKT